MANGGMTNEETRELLIAAGVPPEEIDPAALPFATAMLDAIAKHFAQRLAERIVETVLPLVKEEEQFIAKCAELGIVIDEDHHGKIN